MSVFVIEPNTDTSMLEDHEKISAMRRDYQQGALSPETALGDPMQQFALWFEEAVQKGEPEPNAMVLATISREMCPTARVVLLKGYDAQGFYFYTNYQSHKAADLAQNPNAALVFNWLGQERQVRIEGLVSKAVPSLSDQYYHSRPRASQVGAWVSPQSQPIPNRELLDQRQEQVERSFAGMEALPRPPFWGGYVLVPSRVEFWQGRSSRLHDRLLYQRENEVWVKQRLAP